MALKFLRTSCNSTHLLNKLYSISAMDSEISHDMLGDLIESKLLKVIDEKLTQLVNEKFGEINNKLDVIIENVKENRVNILKVMSDKNKEYERKKC